MATPCHWKNTKTRLVPVNSPSGVRWCVWSFWPTEAGSPPGPSQSSWQRDREGRSSSSTSSSKSDKVDGLENKHSEWRLETEKRPNRTERGALENTDQMRLGQALEFYSTLGV